MLYFVLGAIWFVLTTIVGALMYVTQVGPDQAASNLSQWAVKLGMEDPPKWLKAKSADRKVRQHAAIALAGLLVFGGFLGGMVFDDYLRPPPSVRDVSKNPNHWEPLSPDETLALRSEFRGLSPERLSVLCAIPACADLAESIYSVAHDLNWPGNYEGWYLTDSGIKQGIEIWSYPPKVDARQKIVEAIERSTKARLKVSQRVWDNTPMPEHATDINLVIGRLR